MKKKTVHKRKVLILVVAIVSIGCTMFGFMNENAVAQDPMDRFDPLILPKRDLVPPDPWLDPLVFHSENAYMIRPKRGTPRRRITEIELQQARTLQDLIPEYPYRYITDYVSVNVSTNSDAKEMNAEGLDATLSKKQLELLHAADMGARIDITVVYKKSNPATGIVENNTMRVSTTLVPETEATYVGGNEALTAYLKENIIKQLAKDCGWLKPPTLFFTINEQGMAEDIELAGPSGDQKVDEILINVISDMPKWDPAANAEGIHVKQVFEFTVSQEGC